MSWIESRMFAGGSSECGVGVQEVVSPFALDAASGLPLTTLDGLEEPLLVGSKRRPLSLH
jgi:hypothetical protein